MVVHPPMLYMGYVGFSVAFAFAIAALLGGRLDATWARWSRPWTTVAWSFLTIGIALGSCWAYYTLGWGGWWFWDPVENASFMPWLVGTALIHSLAVTEKRGAFQNWTVLLAILRVLAVAARHVPGALRRADVGARLRDRSARAASSSSAFLAVVIGGSLTLYALRAGAVGVGGRLRAGVARIDAARQQRPAGRRAGQRAARHALPAVPRRAQPRQDLGRPALLRRGVLSADDAAGVPDGRRARSRAGARRASPTCGRGCAGPSYVAAARRCSLPFAMGRWKPLVALGTAARGLDRCRDRGALLQRLRAAPQRGIVAKLAREFAPRGTACCSRTSASRCSSSASRWSRATRSSATCGSTSARASRSAATPTRFRRHRAAVRGPNYDALVGTVEVTRDGRHVDDAEAREARPTARRQADDRGRDRQRHPGRPSTCRWASRSARKATSARGPCASTSSPSSTGSGSAAC